ncbi:MAG: hypothetical protein ACD_54C01181G0002 [uncultured bacterium]|nr:MAG: hypothetical protein ACD_54C01181G0002 [uncultured bacterium]
MGDRLVKGDAGDRQINSGEVFGVGAAQEAGRAGKGVFKGIAALRGAGESGVDFSFGVF